MSKEENRKNFSKYVSQNILGMIGFSCYVLADSYFISIAKGADGLTALNLVMPLYSIIFSIGEMIGVGSAIRYAISKIKKDADADDYFWNALIWCILSSMIFVFAGIFFSADIMRVLGADEHIVAVGNNYTKIFMCFAPMFMCNYVTNAFVRNDGAPGIAMSATLFSSLFNIVFDYILMFPMNLGMEGAALATALSPIIGMGICSIHFFSKKSSVRLVVCKPSVRKLVVFNGVAQGSQPLISSCFGRGDKDGCKQLKRMGYTTALVLAAVMYSILFIFAGQFVAVFNSEGSEMLRLYATEGVKLYFIGIFFAGINIVGGGAFSATEDAFKAAVVSVARGFVLILGAVFVMSALFGMTGVWLAYAVAEGITTFIMLVMVLRV